MNDLYEIYTDGGCFPNPGKGAWALVVIKNGIKIEEKTGSEINTTNNRMEYLAVINALKIAKLMNQPMVIRSDSELLVNTYNVWMDNWAKLGWKRKGKIKEIKNLDLVQELFELKRTMQNGVVVKWVRGHNGNAWNEHCDQLCNQLLNSNSLTSLTKFSKRNVESSEFETDEKNVVLSSINCIRDFLIEQKVSLDSDSN